MLDQRRSGWADVVFIYNFCVFAGNGAVLLNAFCIAGHKQYNIFVITEF